MRCYIVFRARIKGVKLFAAGVSLVLATATLGQRASESRKGLTFPGRQVTVTSPGSDDDGFPKGTASLCIEGPPVRQCYSAGGGNYPIGNNPTATIVNLRKGEPALLFTAESGGTSGWTIEFALLRPEPGTEKLNDLFLDDASVSNQSQHAFWSLPAISDALVFVTADFVEGLGEAHYQAHRYMVSSYAYMLDTSGLIDGPHYTLQDRYMTTRHYDLEKDDVLASEKQEVIARLIRVRVEEKRKAK